MAFMETIVHIDKSGRVVIPKEMREGLGFAPNVPLVVESRDGAVILKPSTAGARMINMGGIMVYHTDAPQDFDVVALIDQVREERNAQVMGIDHDD